MQGDYCRIPYIETSSYKIPKRFHNTACEDEIVLCSDILPTGLEVGLLEVGFLSKQNIPSPPWLEHEISSTSSSDPSIGNELQMELDSLTNEWERKNENDMIRRKK